MSSSAGGKVTLSKGDPQQQHDLSDNSQLVDVDFCADVNVGHSRHDRHGVLVVPAAEVLVLQTLAVVPPAVEVLGGSAVEQPGLAAGACGNRTRLRIKAGWLNRASSTLARVPATTVRDVQASQCTHCGERGPTAVFGTV